MHYALFLGIFGLPVVAGVGMLVARVLTAVVPEEPVTPECVSKDELQDSDAHVSELVDAFFAAPLGGNGKP